MIKPDHFDDATSDALRIFWFAVGAIVTALIFFGIAILAWVISMTVAWPHHSFVRGGKIEFLGDSTHALAGKTVDIPDWPYAEGEYGGV